MGMRAFRFLVLFAAFGCVRWGVGLKTPGLRSTATCTPEHAAVVALTSVRCAGVLERLTGFVGLLSSLRHPGRSTTAGRTELVFVLGSCCESPPLGVVVLHADVMLLLLSVILVAKTPCPAFAAARLRSSDSMCMPRATHELGVWVLGPYPCRNALQLESCDHPPVAQVPSALLLLPCCMCA
jgi:hypothetical protein